MNQEESPNVQNSDEQMIKYLAMVTAFSQQIPSRSNRESKMWWSSFLEPAVLTALITVVIGGLVGGLITHLYQEGVKSRELQQVSYKEHLTQQQEILKRTYSLLGNCIATSNRLIDLTNPKSYNQDFIDKLNEKDLENVHQQIVNTKHSFNEAYLKWETEQAELGLLIDYYHPNQPIVMSSWKEVQKSIMVYMDCAADWSTVHGWDNPVSNSEEFKDACKQELNVLTTHLTEFNTNLKNARHYSWFDATSQTTVKNENR